MNLKLFVWEDVLSTYFEGVVFALADNMEEAKKLILYKANTMDNEDVVDILKLVLEDTPKIYKAEEGVCIIS